MEVVNESEFVFEIGSKVLSWVIQLEFVNSTVKVLSKTEKINILIPGAKLIELFSNVKEPRRIMILPLRIAMIVKPKL